jgi:hypothetical protein
MPIFREACVGDVVLLPFVIYSPFLNIAAASQGYVEPLRSDVPWDG